jgi:gliding motility-associated-like protein
MKHIRLTLFAPLFLLAIVLRAQPEPCGNPAKMQPFCKDACVICDINGFTGVNDAGVTGQAPPGFCTSEVHHMQWIAFIAGSINLSLSVKVTNCQFGYGLEMGIYKTLNCTSFQLVSNCDTDVPNNTTEVFTNTVPLTVGQYYYFVMDGSQNDVCKYTITVVDGTTEVPPLENGGAIKGPDKVCAGTAEKYTFQLPPGAARFEWSFGGVPLANSPDTTVNVNWTLPGTYNLCCIASNACDTADRVCRVIEVLPTASALVKEQLCEGECIEVGGKLLCATGEYDFKLKNSVGCDSLVHASIEVLPASTTNLNLQICEGDTVWVGTTPFTQSGQFQELLATNQNACDSTVNLALQVIVCNIQGGMSAQAARCNGAADGSLQFLVQNGTPPFQYKWTRIASPTGPSGTGSVTGLNTFEKIQNLPAGTYFVTISDNFGNSRVLFEEVTEPSPLVFSTKLSDFNGSNISCNGLSDGSISVAPTGGKPPYQFLWNTGSTQPTLIDLPAGQYTCTLTDAAGCVKTIPVVLSQPEPLVLQAQFDNPGCGGIGTGAASVLSTNGGTPPYEYALTGQVFGQKTDFTNLLPGPYALTVRDANGCTAEQSGFLKAPLIPEIDLGPDLTVDLGEQVRLNLVHNVPLDTHIWAARPGLSCYNCPEPDARPVRTTTYLLTVTAPGGCTDVDSVTVRVNDRRNVYIPNTFSPNDDGHNDRFTVYAGPEVLTVRKLRVYSRWGELVFDGTDLTPNEERGGWDGRFRGRDLPPGVMAWVAEVEFIDGVLAMYEGSVTLVW